VVEVASPPTDTGGPANVQAEAVEVANGSEPRNPVRIPDHVSGDDRFATVAIPYIVVTFVHFGFRRITRQ
jgi:hypothetical protein